LAGGEVGGCRWSLNLLAWKTEENIEEIHQSANFSLNLASVMLLLPEIKFMPEDSKSSLVTWIVMPKLR
jgi:hypothetical protein